MIISASRRSDIPSYYVDWFFKRLEEKYLYVRNPMNYRQISKINLSPDVVDGIVFWTKNPSNMLERLGELKDYPFYFQFTLNSYGNDIEQNLPKKSDVLIPVFKKLSSQTSPKQIIWRYDPILINEKYTMDYHLEYFEKMASQLSGFTEKVSISFLDYYRNIKGNIEALKIRELTDENKRYLAENISKTAKNYSMEVCSCGESIDLSAYGIRHGKCIDEEIFQAISGYNLKIKKDKNQRLHCGCMESIDIGMYNTCANGCKYCYANHSIKTLNNNISQHKTNSPILSGEISEVDIIKERAVKSLKSSQLSIEKF